MFAQALFYATLMALHRAYDSEALKAYLTVGCLLGLTFLAHTAPALIIGGIMVLGTFGILRLGDISKARLTGTFLALACAAVISLPLTISIVGRYQLRVLNSAPASWESGEMLLAKFLNACLRRPLDSRHPRVSRPCGHPYVDREVRIDARRFMWDALRAGDQTAFCRTADSFKVTHVILGEEHSGEWAPKMRPFQEPVFSAGPLRIWRVYGCQPGRG